MRLPAALLALSALAAALSGCSAAEDDPVLDPAPDLTPDGSHSDGPTAEPEGDSGVFYVQFKSDGPATLEVPFPTLDSCLAPEDWMAGQASTSANATAQVREADGRGGKVLALSGQGFVSWSMQIPPGPQCQAFQADPWSVDPDPADGAVDVRLATGATRETMVVVRLTRGGCIDASNYEGETAPGWSTLQGRSLQDSCA